MRIIMLLGCLGLASGTWSQASGHMLGSQHIIEYSIQMTASLPPFVVGDKANYAVKGGMLTGTLDMKVAEFVPEGVWIHQNLKTNMFGDQLIEALVDPSTRKIKRYLVDGREQNVPPEFEVLEKRNETVTVAAGTFNCIYVRGRNPSNGSEVEKWSNFEAVPVAGMVKSYSQGPSGPTTIELVSFSRASALH